MSETLNIEVLAHCQIAHGGGVLAHQKLSSQLTKCRVDGVTFYVRENLDHTSSFVISSGERWGFKGGNSGRDAAAMNRQVLNLAAPDECWDCLAQLVEALDQFHRPVRRHRLFTAAWAERELQKGKR